MTEQDLHDYNKWLVEVWSPNELYISRVMSAPKAFLKYRAQSEVINNTNFNRLKLWLKRLKI
jgi:hypothetical protein